MLSKLSCQDNLCCTPVCVCVCRWVCTCMCVGVDVLSQTRDYCNALATANRNTDLENLTGGMGGMGGRLGGDCLPASTIESFISTLEFCCIACYQSNNFVR